MENKFEYAYDLYCDEEEYEKAYSLFLELANDEDVNAQIMVASMLYEGKEISKNIEESYYWYQKAADNGHIQSSHFYSFYCFDNNNFTEGKSYLQKAVDRNYIDAIYNMAIYTLNGTNGYEKDEEKAITLFKKSALLDDMESYLQIWRIKAKKFGKKEAYTYMAEEFGLPPCWKMLKYRFSKYYKKIMKKEDN